MASVILGPGASPLASGWLAAADPVIDRTAAPAARRRSSASNRCRAEAHRDDERGGELAAAWQPGDLLGLPGGAQRGQDRREVPTERVIDVGCARREERPVRALDHPDDDGVCVG